MSAPAACSLSFCADDVPARRAAAPAPCGAGGTTVHILLAPPARARIGRGCGVEVASWLAGAGVHRHGGGAANDVDLSMPGVSTCVQDAGKKYWSARARGRHGKEEKDGEIDGYIRAVWLALFFQPRSESE